MQGSYLHLALWLAIPALLWCILTSHPVPESSLAGQVRSLSGAPLAAQVSIVGIDARTSTDEAGRFRLPYPPGRFIVRYEAPGHLPLDQEWWFADAREVTLTPIELVPPPQREGLWRMGADGYLGFPRQALTFQETDTLGLTTLKRRRLGFTENATEVCLEQPLLFQDSSSAEEAPLLALQVTNDGELKPGAGMALSSAGIQVTAVAHGLWRIELERPGPIALLPQSLEQEGALPEGWYLNGIACGGTP